MKSLLIAVYGRVNKCQQITAEISLYSRTDTMKKIVSLITLGLIIAIPSLAQNQAPLADDDGFRVFMLMLLFAFGIAILMAIIFFVLVLLAILLLTALGVISVSVLTGLYYRSFRTGLKALMIIGSALFGGAGGVVGLFLFRYFSKNPLAVDWAWLLAGLVGGLAGLFSGFVALRLGRILFRNMKARYHVQR